MPTTQATLAAAVLAAALGLAGCSENMGKGAAIGAAGGAGRAR